MIKSSVILDERELREAVDYFRTKKAFAFDVEAQGEHREVAHLANLSWLSMATEGAAIAIPFGHPIGDKIIGTKRVQAVYGPKAQKAGQTYFRNVPEYEQPPDQIERRIVFEIIEPLFFDSAITKIGHDVVYDLTATAKYWDAVPVPPYRDTKIGLWLVNENERRLGLKEWVDRIFEFRYDFEGIGAAVETYPFSLVAYYSYCDSKFDWLLDKLIRGSIDEQNLNSVYNMEMNVLNVMVGMRLAGARVDMDRLRELETTLSAKLVDSEGKIFQAAGKRFNVNSVPQRQDILYAPKASGGQGLKPWKLTTGGLKKKEAGLTIGINDYSTDDDVLASYPDNAVANAIREYGDIAKLLSTYVSSWLGSNDKDALIYDEHIHAGFQQYGTVTGRFSCRTPNLQNIPRPSSELGRLIRGAFIAEESGKLIVADYGQIELVVLAHYLGEGKLYEAFMSGIDPHTMTAAMVLGKKPEDVTQIERQDLGKTLGFAVVYGAGLHKVASMAHISVDEARTVLKKHRKMFPEIHGFRDAVLELARSRTPVPYITTLSGRKRRIPELMSPVEKIRMGAERQTFNSLIQGGAADIIKWAMVRIDSALPPEIQLILTVHDEIVLASPEAMAQEAADLLREAMLGEGIQKLVRVPLLAEVKIVDRWSDAK